MNPCVTRWFLLQYTSLNIQTRLKADVMQPNHKSIMDAMYDCMCVCVECVYRSIRTFPNPCTDSILCLVSCMSLCVISNYVCDECINCVFVLLEEVLQFLPYQQPSMICTHWWLSGDILFTRLFSFKNSYRASIEEK